MSAVTNHSSAAAITAPPRTDSFATGVAFMLVLTVGQRLTGFVRNVLFCRFLDEDQLGQWSLMFSFLLLLAPLAVLGLPGSFGRYVEYYRNRGQLRQFLRRTTLVTVGLAASVVVLVCLSPDWFSWVVFNESGHAQLIYLMAATLAAAVAFNYLSELLTALRQVRVVSLMTFVSSMVFAVVAFALIGTTQLGTAGVVVAFAVSYLIASIPALCTLCRLWRDLPMTTTPLGQGELWAKLLPFAASVWMINLLANLFDAADRYMILHCSTFDAHTAQSLVGQYHSSRVVPALLISIAMMLSGVVLPYLSADWEAGRRDKVSRRLNSTLKFTGLGFTAGSVLVLYAAPLLFDWVMAGKYGDGLAVLPWTLIYCIWFSLAVIVQTYLWCAERARLVSFAMLLGLAVNVVLNYLLLPYLGLLGAVLATAAANAVSLVLIKLFCWGWGMRLDAGTWLVGLLPLVLALGALPASVVLLVVGWLAWRGTWFFTADEKRDVSQFVARFRRQWNSFGA